ncbi:hypothetical protein MKW94_028506 [Papaver nudicaule]|uniref:Uncharacterized protein n=1 Tax=Papaver nudicaule TaxID=74823 RepID=A0AA41S319_PAPNU|nr:hypothetical protein [Papaver nudicaule]
MSVSAIYDHVVDDVVSKIRAIEGINDSVRNDIRALWKLKIMQQAQTDTAPRGPAVPSPVQDLNVPYQESIKEADMVFTPKPVVETSGEPGSYQYYYPSAQSNQYVTTDKRGAVAAGKRTSCEQEGCPAKNQRPLGIDVNVAYEDFSMPPGKRSKIDSPPNLPLQNNCVQPEGEEDEEPPLNEDDDDLDTEDDEDESSINNVLLCQFEKVSKAAKSSKWKCILKDGIMHLNGRDILFAKANGEFDF